MLKIVNLTGVVFITALALSAISGSAMAAASNPRQIAISVKSSDPSRVTGGDALIEVVTPGAKLTVTANGTDVSSVFKAGAEPDHHLGVVGGLKLGENTIVASGEGGSATLKLVNYPINGPVFAGPKEQPFFCETTRFKLADGTTLPEPLDKDCSVKTVVTYVYKPTGGKEFKPLPSRTQLPADVAQATTTLGKKVPYVVRVEAGTIDRGIYQIAMLHDPTSEPAPTPVVAPKAWNKRMVYVFAGGCLGMYRQGPTTGPLLDDQFVGQGYVAVSNSLNVFANNCDDLLSAESMMMTRERAIELVGTPVFTLGWGCSGGSHQVLQISDNYPGLMDGIVPMCNSVDWTRFQQFYSDLRLLYDWFKQPAAQGLTHEQKVAITGVPLNTEASDLGRSVAKICPPVVPASMVFDPKTNPQGVRCTITEHQVNSVGRDPMTGFARNVVDNVGVQYGLTALQSGKISVAHFLDLNEQVGGYDANGERSSARAVADPEGVAAEYRTGRVLNAGGGLRDIPILELRNYSDLDESAVHTKYGTYATLARLVRETGTRANYVVLLESHRDGFMSANRLGGDQMSMYALKKMDEWLTALVGNVAPGTRLEKIVRSKPSDLSDSCYDRNGERIVEEQRVSGGRCNELYPTHLPPRMIAGGPLTNDVLKCQLKAVDARDYKVNVAAAEVSRLKKIFPDGVCDWSKPGVGQVKPTGTWQSF